MERLKFTFERERNKQNNPHIIHQAIVEPFQLVSFF